MLFLEISRSIIPCPTCKLRRDIRLIFRFIKCCTVNRSPTPRAEIRIIMRELKTFNTFGGCAQMIKLPSTTASNPASATGAHRTIPPVSRFFTPALFVGVGVVVAAEEVAD
jgi:hypothetical protein